VASRLLGSGRFLGIVPMGAFNFFARSLDLPQSVDEAVDLIATGSPVTVTLGDVNGRIFINNASLGLYPAFLQQREDIYRRWGRSRLAAYWSVLVTLDRFRHPLTLRLDTGVNTVNHFAWQRGLARAHTIRRVCKAFARDPRERMHVAMLHHPLEHLPEVRKQLTRGTGAALEALEKCGTDIVLSGHLHT